MSYQHDFIKKFNVNKLLYELYNLNDKNSFFQHYFNKIGIFDPKLPLTTNPAVLMNVMSTECTHLFSEYLLDNKYIQFLNLEDNQMYDLIDTVFVAQKEFMCVGYFFNTKDPFLIVKGGLYNQLCYYYNVKKQKLVCISNCNYWKQSDDFFRRFMPVIEYMCKKFNLNATIHPINKCLFYGYNDSSLPHHLFEFAGMCNLINKKKLNENITVVVKKKAYCDYYFPILNLIKKQFPLIKIIYDEINYNNTFGIPIIFHSGIEGNNCSNIFTELFLDEKTSKSVNLINNNYELYVKSINLCNNLENPNFIFNQSYIFKESITNTIQISFFIRPLDLNRSITNYVDLISLTINNLQKDFPNFNIKIILNSNGILNTKYITMIEQKTYDNLTDKISGSIQDLINNKNINKGEKLTIINTVKLNTKQLYQINSNSALMLSEGGTCHSTVLSMCMKIPLYILYAHGSLMDWPMVLHYANYVKKNPHPLLIDDKNNLYSNLKLTNLDKIYNDIQLFIKKQICIKDINLVESDSLTEWNSDSKEEPSTNAPE